MAAGYVTLRDLSGRLCSVTSAAVLQIGILPRFWRLRTVGGSGVAVTGAATVYYATRLGMGMNGLPLAGGTLTGGLTLQPSALATLGDPRLSIVSLGRAVSGAGAQRLTTDGAAASASNVPVVPDYHMGVCSYHVHAISTDAGGYQAWWGGQFGFVRLAGVGTMSLFNILQLGNLGAATPQAVVAGSAIIPSQTNNVTANTNARIAFSADTTNGGINLSFTDAGNGAWRVTAFLIITSGAKQ